MSETATLFTTSNVTIMLNSLILLGIGILSRSISGIHQQLKIMNGRLSKVEGWRESQERMCKERLHNCERVIDEVGRTISRGDSPRNKREGL